MITRAIKDAKDLTTDELIYFKGHAKATYMSSGDTVENVINNIQTTINTTGNYVTIGETETITGQKSFTSPVQISTSVEGAILELSSAASNTNFQLKRTSGSTIVLESGNSVGLIGTMTDHPLQLRTGYTKRVQVNTDGTVELTVAPTEDTKTSLQVDTVGARNTKLAQEYTEWSYFTELRDRVSALESSTDLSKYVTKNEIAESQSWMNTAGTMGTTIYYGVGMQGMDSSINTWYVRNDGNAGFKSITGIDTGNSYWYINYLGNALFNSVTQTSDATKKNIIEDVQINTQTIADAPSIRFNWKDRPEEISVGTTAQYWKDKLPEVVRGEEGSYSVDYGVLATLNTISLAKTIVEQQQYIKKLELEIISIKEHLSL